MSDIVGDFQDDGESQMYSTDYLQEDEDICDICKNVRNTVDLKEVESTNGGTVLVCSDCTETGWPEE